MVIMEFLLIIFLISIFAGVFGSMVDLGAIFLIATPV